MSGVIFVAALAAGRFPLVQPPFLLGLFLLLSLVAQY